MDVSPWCSLPSASSLPFFLKEIFAQASPDAKMMVIEGSKKTSTLRNQLSELFDSADMSGDEMVHQEESLNMLMLSKVKLWLSELGANAE